MVLLLIRVSPVIHGETPIPRWHRGMAVPAMLQNLTDPVLLTRKSFAGRKGFFFAKSSRSWRSSRLRGESWAGLSPRRREAREENATSKTRQRRRPHIANAVRRRQRRDVQQQARGAVFRRKRRQTDTVAAHARPFDKFSALLTIPSASVELRYPRCWPRGPRARCAGPGRILRACPCPCKAGRQFHSRAGSRRSPA